MGLENSIHEALEREPVVGSNKSIEDLRRKAFSAYLEDIKKYRIGKTIAYAIGGTFLGGIFSYIVFPFAPLLALFGYLGTAAGVYVGHDNQFDNTRKVTSSLEKSMHDAETEFYGRLMPQQA